MSPCQQSSRSWSRALPVLLGLLLGLLPGAVARADAPLELRAAVTSSFAAAFQRLAEVYEADSGIPVLASHGATGLLYSQILAGGPFQVFLAADAERPRRLEEEGLGRERFTYAVGRLVLWSRDPDLVAGGPEVLGSERFSRLAIAQPEVAPYGAAARQTLRSLGLWERLEDRLVRGENVAQAYQFVATGNAELGFVSLAQLTLPEDPGGSRWLVPEDLHQPLRQQAVLLPSSPREEAAARLLLRFLRSPGGQEIIRAAGYRLP